MPTINKIQIMGHVGKEPEIRQTKAGKDYAKFSIATKRYAKKGENAVTDWHNITLWGYYSNRPIGKGDLVLINGEINYREYDGKHYTDIIANEYINLDYKKYMNTSNQPRQEVRQELSQNSNDDVPF